MPNKTGASLFSVFSSALFFLVKNFGRVSCSFLKKGNISNRFIPNTNITKNTRRLNIKLVPELKVKEEPIIPIIPPSIKKLIILEI